MKRYTVYTFTSMLVLLVTLISLSPDFFLKYFNDDVIDTDIQLCISKFPNNRKTVSIENISCVWSKWDRKNLPTLTNNDERFIFKKKLTKIKNENYFLFAQGFIGELDIYLNSKHISSAVNEQVTFPGYFNIGRNLIAETNELILIFGPHKYKEHSRPVFYGPLIFAHGDFGKLFISFLITERFYLPIFSFFLLFIFLIFFLYLISSFSHLGKSEIEFLYLIVSCMIHCLSMSRFLREFILGESSFPLHFLIRTNMDFAISFVSCSIFSIRKGILWKVIRSLYYFSFGIFLILTLSLFLNDFVSETALPAFLIGRQTSYEAGRTLVLSFAFGHFLIFLTATKNYLTKNKIYLEIIIMLGIVVLMHFYDLVRYAGFINSPIDSFFVRFYPTLICFVFGARFFKQIVASYSNQQLNAEVGMMTSQVAHDIKSPIGALKILGKMTTNLTPQETKVLLNSTKRIEEISKSILRHKNTESGSYEEELSRINLEQILKKIAAEKIFEYRSRIKINFNMCNSDPLFITVQEIQFHRVISNLLNNSFEASTDLCVINFEVKTLNSKLIITIADNGKGIPPEFLKRLGNQGATFQKPNGNGLGLFHAIRCVEKWKGSFHIDSVISKGTTVTIILPIT